MAAVISIRCGNVDDGDGTIRAKIDAVHIRVDGADVYNADGTQKRYRFRIVPSDEDNENDVSSGYSELFAPDANGDHEGFPGGYIFPAADDYTIELWDEEQAGSAADAIASSSAANPTVVTTSAPHGLTSGETVVIAGHTSTPTINGSRVVTVTGPTTFTVPVNVTVAGTAGGTVATGGVITSLEVEVV
jgi:hypothetical protein